MLFMPDMKLFDLTAFSLQLQESVNRWTSQYFYAENKFYHYYVEYTSYHRLNDTSKPTWYRTAR